MSSARRTMCASVLGFECIALALSAIVLISVVHVSVAWGLGAGLGLAVAAVLVAALLRFEWAYLLGFLLQVVAVGLGFLITAMFVIGGAFGALYIAAYILGRRIERDEARLAAGGQAPGPGAAPPSR